MFKPSDFKPSDFKPSKLKSCADVVNDINFRPLNFKQEYDLLKEEEVMIYEEEARRYQTQLYNEWLLKQKTKIASDILLQLMNYT